MTWAGRDSLPSPVRSFTKPGFGKYFFECWLLCTSISPAQMPSPLPSAVWSRDWPSLHLLDRSVLPEADWAVRVRRSPATGTFPQNEAAVGIALPGISHRCSTTDNTRRTVLPVFPLPLDTPAFDR